MSADITSKVTILQNMSMISYAVSWTGTAPIGVMGVQVSNDYSQNGDGTVRNPGTWTFITLSPAPAVSGDTGTGFIDIVQTAAFAMRLVYTRTSGTGVMQATIIGKVA